jgi:hypothetical protein
VYQAPIKRRDQNDGQYRDRNRVHLTLLANDDSCDVAYAVFPIVSRTGRHA